MQLCIAALPLHAARLELRRTSPDDKLQRTSRQPLLFLTRYVSALPDTNKTPTRCALVFQRPLFRLEFPSQLSCHSHALIDSRRSQFISFTAVCGCARRARACDCASGSRASHRGGKHRLIKSTGGPPVNTALRSLLPSHYRDAVRSRLIISIQGVCKRTGAIHLNGECAGGRLISRKGAGREIRGCLWASADVKLEQPVP